jgi:hypothetical protein
VGEFPQGESPGASESQAGAAGGQSGSEQAGAVTDPGFGEGASGAESLPDLLDEPSFEEALGALEGAMGDPGQAQGSSEGGGATGSSASGGGEGATGGNSGIPGGSPESTPGGGPLTPAEQVAILDAQLERGTGEFDSMILEQQAEQRRTARSQPPSTSKSGTSESGAGDSGGGYGGDGYGGEPPEGGSTGGGYSTGGGMGGASGGGQIPRNTAKYPPPKDIPSGNDDDVVARQLREAAMSEPDPAVREKLWDEYRKYKGISQ